MEPIRTLIVDDEELCRKGIRLMLEGDKEFQILGECANGEEAIRKIRAEKPEIVFLDIKMPEVSGFDVIKRIDPEELPLIVFVTAYDEHAVKAFEVHALDYVLKPFTRTRFEETLKKIKKTLRDRNASRFIRSLIRMMSSLDASQLIGGAAASNTTASSLDRVLVSERGAFEVVRIKDIEWIEGADYYVHLHCRGKSYLYRERLKNLEEKLSPDRFFRVHRSAIINLSFLEKIVVDYRKQVHALMKSGAKVPISRSRRKDFFAMCREQYGLKA